MPDNELHEERFGSAGEDTKAVATIGTLRPKPRE